MTDKGIEYIANSSINPNIRKLDLSHCLRLTARCSDHLSKLQHMRELNISGQHWVNGNTIKHVLSQIARNIECLTIGDSCADDKVDNDVILFIATMPNLRKLNIHGCHHVTDDGVKFLARASLSQLRAQHINVLCVASCNITDDAMQSIAQMRYLRHLDISFCGKVTDKGLEYLIKAPNLRKLNISHCDGITENGKNILLASPIMIKDESFYA